MNNEDNRKLGEYNSFCKDLRVGHILYNIDSGLWGEYLLVANVTAIEVGNTKTYTVLLLGLKKEEGKYVPRNMSVSLTPDHIGHIPFLKHVGHCKLQLLPVMEELKVDVGLAAVYGNTDLHKFTSRLSIRKPRTKKYGKDGKPVKK